MTSHSTVVALSQPDEIDDPPTGQDLAQAESTRLPDQVAVTQFPP